MPELSARRTSYCNRNATSYCERTASLRRNAIKDAVSDCIDAYKLSFRMLYLASSPFPIVAGSTITDQQSAHDNANNKHYLFNIFPAENLLPDSDLKSAFRMGSACKALRGAGF